MLELGRLLTLAGGPVRGRVTTRVDDPGEAIDCYGRLVGYLRIWIGRRSVDVNLWLLRRGLALPCFYTSSQPAAIARALVAAGEARRARRGIWRWIEDDGRRFRGLPARAEPNGGSDSGPLASPKIFRRQCTMLARSGELARARPRYDWHELRAELATSGERAVEREAWIREVLGGAAARRLKWGELIGERGELRFGAGDVVWEEK